MPEIGKWEQTRYVSKHVTTWITWSRAVPQESIHPMAASSSQPHRPFLTVTQYKTFWTLCKKRLAALQHSSYPEELTVIQHQKYQMSLMSMLLGQSDWLVEAVAVMITPCHKSQLVNSSRIIVLSVSIQEWNLRGVFSVIDLMDMSGCLCLRTIKLNILDLIDLLLW